ncbi:MAG: RluA family pseudouridine synthase [Clostridiales Family XIII bacterium]|jgi:23S rRNA pseudouridine1911/1915/1917 synthase|nr:RluA family pseudouridine synthase [Clostridiales Family XIII bacterium]
MTDELYLETEETEEREAVFGDGDAGKRLDAAIAERFPDLSRSRVQELIASGGVRIAGKSGTPSKSARICPGDEIKITLYKRVPLNAMPEDIPLNIVYEDDDVIVIDKARGMVVHPARGNETGTVVNALLGHLGEDALSCVNGAVRPGIVHRIDKNTSGLLVIAKNDLAHAGLAGQFHEHSIDRRYMAIAIGAFREEEGTIDAPLGRDPSNRLRQAVRREPGGRRAVTHWRVLERLGSLPGGAGNAGEYTLIELSLETGRTHQIRVHLAYISRPVLGDDLYGPAKGLVAGQGQYLHACALGFDHPRTGERLCFESAPPAYFREMLRKLKG